MFILPLSQNITKKMCRKLSLSLPYLCTFLGILSCLFLGGCAAQKRVLYLQDIEAFEQSQIVAAYQIRFKPLDRITVVVSSQNPELAVPFNSSSAVPAMSEGGAPATTELQPLTISADGMLDMPVIGKIQAAGLTRSELSDAIADAIRDGGYVDDPTVNIQFIDMYVNVIGEVQKPDQYEISSDQVTIFEAIAMAGDLTIQGQRKNVTVIREVDGVRTVGTLDLRSKNIFTSPFFYLQQGDIVWVKPNRSRAKSGQIDPNQGLYFSLVGTLVSVATLVATLVLAK